MKTRTGCLLTLVLGLLSGCAIGQESVELPDLMQPEQTKSIMAKVANWQLEHPSKHSTAHWTHGALFAGISAWAQMADDDKYIKALLEFGEKNNWQPNNDVSLYHADNHCVGQMYLEMYSRFKEPKMLKGIKDRFDYILANRSHVTLHINEQKGKDRWWWCDALFMGPPVLAKLAAVTGEPKYLLFMNEEWWYTTDYLYDTEEHLYYRDENYFKKREANGKKVFWSRGNGWVFAGLARVLESMPKDFKDRPRYEKLYKEMAAKIVKIQPAEGLWHSSLLDPVSYPSKETSGSGFYCYGLAWGINQGLLDEKTYLPAVIKAWTGLVSCVHPDGKLGYVQPIGADPRQVDANQTEIYGVGAFLLAGSEVYKISIRHTDGGQVRKGAPVKKLTITNPIIDFRDRETIGLSWAEVEKAVPGLTKKDAAVFDFKTNHLLVTQVVNDGEKAQLLFQTNFAPGEKKYFWLMKQPQGLQKPVSETTTYCRFVPERKDDFAWENDKVAFRVYGPALEDETITSGIDAWGKCVSYPVIDKFYKSESYHENHGEGGDFYKVGNTLGCGGAAPFVNGKISLPRNFREWKIIANGPIRSVFELTYAPWKADTRTVSEKKRISIDLGSNLNKIECTYSGENSQDLPVAAGIVLRDSSNEKFTDTKNVIGYWLPADGNNGMMGCGVVFGQNIQAELTVADSHLLMVVNQPLQKPFIYYCGSCWNENKDFKTFEQWKEYLKNFKRRIDNPVVIEFAN
jgi:unsaturated rhamnogalacturonyl hydrolase